METIEKYIVHADVGNSIIDILRKATQVRFDDIWYNILGYDETDDVLCVENHLQQDADYTITNASLAFKWYQFKVDSLVIKGLTTIPD